MISTYGGMYMFKFLEGGCFPRRQSEETPSIAMVCSPQLCLISYFLILSGALRREGLEQSEGKGGIFTMLQPKAWSSMFEAQWLGELCHHAFLRRVPSTLIIACKTWSWSCTPWSTHIEQYPGLSHLGLLCNYALIRPTDSCQLGYGPNISKSI